MDELNGNIKHRISDELSSVQIQQKKEKQCRDAQNPAATTGQSENLCLCDCETETVCARILNRVKQKRVPVCESMWAKWVILL